MPVLPQLLRKRFHHDTLSNDSIDWWNSLLKSSIPALSIDPKNGLKCGKTNSPTMPTEWKTISPEETNDVDSKTKISFHMVDQATIVKKEMPSSIVMTEKILAQE